MHTHRFTTLRTILFGCVTAVVATHPGAVTLCAAGHPNTTSLVESTPTSAFVNNQDGTITHLQTGLTWKHCAEGMTSAPSACTGSPTQLDWQSALTAANRDSTQGKIDWRLPNIKELLSIAEYCGYDPAINLVVLPSTPAGAFWSSTTVDMAKGNAWIYGTSNGAAGGALKTSAFNYARLVRGGPIASTYDANVALLCNADIDGNGQIDALTDGLLFMRALFGLTGTAVTTGAVGLGTTRTDWAKVRAYMNANCGTNFSP